LNEACEKTKGTMSAVLGLTAIEVKEIVHSLQPSPIWVANYNCPGQTVISGTQEGMEAAAQFLKTKGAKRVIPLQVHGAFHSGLMQSAQDKLAPAIAQTQLSDSPIAIVMNVPGDYVDSLGQVKENLTRQVTQSVCWEQGIRSMMKRGVTLYLELGCSKTLTGMNKKIGMMEPCFSVDRISDLDELARQEESL
jgi:[acyl-carrier-protein] S-malonyltransferase